MRTPPQLAVLVAVIVSGLACATNPSHAGEPRSSSASTGMQLPPPVKSFLKGHDLEGKTVIPFNTQCGSGAGSSFQTIQELCANSRILEGFSIKGGMERDDVFLAIEGKRRDEVHVQVKHWLQRISMPLH